MIIVLTLADIAIDCVIRLRTGRCGFDGGCEKRERDRERVRRMFTDVKSGSDTAAK